MDRLGTRDVRWRERREEKRRIKRRILEVERKTKVEDRRKGKIG